MRLLQSTHRFIWFITILASLLPSSCKKQDAGGGGKGNDRPDAPCQTCENGGTVGTGQLVNMTVTAAMSVESYTGSIRGKQAEFHRTSDSTLSFMVPFDAAAGLVSIKVPDLGIHVQYTVNKTQLPASAQETAGTFRNRIRNYVSQGFIAEEDEDGELLRQALGQLDEMLEQATPAQLEEVALFYRANLALVSEIINPDVMVTRQMALSDPRHQAAASGSRYGQLRFDSNTQLIVKQKISTLAFSAGVVLAIGAITPETKLAGAVLAAIAWHKSKQYFLEIGTRRLRRINLLFEKVTEPFMQGRMPMAQANQALSGAKPALTFWSTVPATLPVSLESRTFTAADEGAQGIGIASFFFSAKYFNKAVDLLNAVIREVNDKVFFANLSLVDAFTFGDTDQAAPEQLTAAFIDRFSLTIKDPNISVSSFAFASGVPRLTVEMTDESMVKDEFVDTEVAYRYDDGIGILEGTTTMRVWKKPKYTLEVGARNAMRPLHNPKYWKEIRPMYRLAMGQPDTVPNYSKLDVRLLLNGQAVSDWTVVELGSYPESRTDIELPDFEYILTDKTTGTEVAFPVQLTLLNDLYRKAHNTTMYTRTGNGQLVFKYEIYSNRAQNVSRVKPAEPQWGVVGAPFRYERDFVFFFSDTYTTDGSTRFEKLFGRIYMLSDRLVETALRYNGEFVFGTGFYRPDDWPEDQFCCVYQ